MVRYAAEARGSVAALQGILVPTPSGARVPLGSLAQVSLEEGPAQVSREQGSRLVTVQSNVRGRDVASFVADVQERIEAEVELPPGYRVEYGGQFENLQAASRRLSLVVPMALALIFLLLSGRAHANPGKPQTATSIKTPEYVVLNLFQDLPFWRRKTDPGTSWLRRPAAQDDEM